MTKEDLEQIGKLFEAEREHTRKIVREVVEANNRILGTIIKVELAETNKRIDATAQDTKELKKGQEQLERHLDKSVQDHEERIEIIEEHLGLPPKN